MIIIVALCWMINPRAWIADDSYFYLVIARNIAQLGTPTFSGVIATNGAHPLWMWMLGMWASFLNYFSPGWLSAPQFGVIVSAACLALAAFYYSKLAESLGVSKDSVVILVAFSSFFGVLGSECHISLLMLCYFCWRLSSLHKQDNFKNLTIVGISAALTVLARLDNIFVVLILLFAEIIPCLRRRGLMMSLLPLFVLSVSVGFYLLSNEKFFGGAMPVSGWMKSSFPAFSFRGLEQGSNPTILGVAIIWGWIPMIITMVSLCVLNMPNRALLIKLFLGLVAKNLYIVFFTRSHTNWYWYSTLDVFVISLVFSCVHKKFGATFYFAQAMRSIALLLLIAHVAKAATWSMPNTSGMQVGYELIVKNTKPGDTILVSDYPGYVAFYAPDRHIFAADLLTANRRWYGEMIKQKNAIDYIRETCDKAGAPLTHVLWNGNKWLVPSEDNNFIVFNDPRKYPAESEIGRLILPQPPINQGGAKIWSIKNDSKLQLR